jgi:hypothetical protein
VRRNQHCFSKLRGQGVTVDFFFANIVRRGNKILYNRISNIDFKKFLHIHFLPAFQQSKSRQKEKKKKKEHRTSQTGKEIKLKTATTKTQEKIIQYLSFLPEPSNFSPKDKKKKKLL